MEKRFFFYLIVLCGFIKPSEAQFYPARVYTLEEGMPSYFIYDIAQTPDGVMWFMSSRGVFNYNSVEWELMPDSLDLPFTANSILKTADDGTLWVAGKNKEGFAIKYLSKGKWSAIDSEDQKAKVGGFAFNVRVKGSGYQIFLSYEGMVHVIDTETGSESSIIVGDNLDIGIGPTSIYFAEGKTYLSTLKGLFEIGDNHVLAHPVNSLLGEEKEILAVTENEGVFYLLGSSWIGKFDGEQVTYLTNDNGIGGRGSFNKHYIAVGPAGRIFFGSGSTPAYFDQNLGTINYLNVIEVNHAFHGNKAFVDQEGSVWIGSHRGLFKFSFFDFRNYNKETGLADHEVSSIYEWGSSIVLANSNHLNFITKGQWKESVGLSASPGFRVLDMDQDDRGRLYIAARRGGLVRYDAGSLKELNYLVPNDNSISSVKFFDDQIHFAGLRGIYAVNGRNCDLVVSKELIRNLEVIGEDTLAAFSTLEGILLYHDGDTSSFTSNNLKYNVTYSAVKWRGELLVATSGGVGKIEGDSIVPYEPLSELENVAVYCFLVKEGSLWLGSNLGVYKWDGTSLNHLNKNDGLLGIEVNRNGLIADSNGNIWIGTESGASSYTEELDPHHSSIPKLTLKARTTDQNTLLLDGETDLKYDDNTVDFSFLVHSYIDENQTKYRFTLKGFEEEWVEGYSGNSVRYSSLPAGEYTFSVQANPSGQGWSEPVDVNFSISKAFFAQLWFQLIVAVVVIQIAFRIRYKVLLRREATLKQLVNQKTRELEVAIDDLKSAQQRLIQSEKMASLGTISAGIGHEINNPLNYITNGVRLLSKEMDEDTGFTDREKVDQLVEIINEGTSKVAKIVQSLNQFSKDDRKHKEPCDIGEIIDNCLLILHKSYGSRIEVLKEYEDEVQVMGYPGRLHQVFTSVLSNAEQAIEGEGIVVIRSKMKNGSLVVKISDNGAGIDQNNLKRVFDPFFTTKAPGTGTGLGLSISYSIIKEHGGDLKVLSTPGKGTEVVITLPT